MVESEGLRGTRMFACASVCTHLVRAWVLLAEGVHPVINGLFFCQLAVWLERDVHGQEAEMAFKGRSIRWGIVLVAVGLTCSARADLEHWQDDSGVIYYRERPVVVDATADPHPRAQPKHRARARANQPAAHPVNRRSQRAAREEAKADARQQRQCDHWRHQLAQVEHALQAGYREPRGNQLRSRQRELSGQIFDNCH